MAATVASALTTGMATLTSQMAAWKLIIQGPEGPARDHVETSPFRSHLGLKKVVSQTRSFDSTRHQVMSLFLTVLRMHNTV